MPITPGQAFLSLPAGLTEADYPVADNLLDYTPPDVRWQAPLAPTGENVYANYVKAYPDLLREYNRKLARPLGSTGSLPANKYGAPISMAEYGYGHWGSLGEGEGRTLTKAPGVWGDPSRSPYLPYFYPGKSIEIEEDFTEEQIEEAQAINEAVTQAGTSQVITGGGGSIVPATSTTSTTSVDDTQQTTSGDDDQTVQEEFEEEVDESQPAYPFGHTNYNDWYMDDRNQFGHWWALENASAWTDPDTGQRHVQGPKTWNFASQMWV